MRKPRDRERKYVTYPKNAAGKWYNCEFNPSSVVPEPRLTKLSLGSFILKALVTHFKDEETMTQRVRRVDQGHTARMQTHDSLTLRYRVRIPL